VHQARKALQSREGLFPIDARPAGQGRKADRTGLGRRRSIAAGAPRSGPLIAVVGRICMHAVDRDNAESGLTALRDFRA
jgi:hypothetical protein